MELDSISLLYSFLKIVKQTIKYFYLDNGTPLIELLRVKFS